MNNATPTAPMTLPTAPTVPPTPIVMPSPAAPFIEPHSHAGITGAEAAQIVGDIRADVAKGRITEAEAAWRYDALVATPEQRATDTRTAAEIELDLAFSSAKAQDYNIP